MEFVILTVAVLLLMAILFLREAHLAKKRRIKFRQSLYDNYGKLPMRKYTMENSAHIPGYYQRHMSDGQLDDITWDDLNMDDVFKRMNYTHSATGEEYLYYMLRNVKQKKESLDHFEELVEWFMNHEDERANVQFLMSELGYTGKYSLYDYIENLDYLGERSNFKEHLCNALYIPLIFLLPFRLSLAVIGIVCLSIYRMVTYFKEKSEVESYIVSFAYIARLIRTGESICKLNLSGCENELSEIKKCLNMLRGISSGFYWVSAIGSPKTDGNPLEVLMDYVRMIFHVDLMVFNRMLKKLYLNLEWTDMLISSLGLLEAAVSVGCFRASLENGWCVPELNEEHVIELIEGYHPLLEKPVKNSIHASQGVLLTGSNASGKSTFLRMVAINAILAQTIHTCMAAKFKSPIWAIYSSMALRDNICSGESYYIVEIKALKRILDARKNNEKVLCFVDEVLRGTNTVERIAASTQILKSLSEGNVICFAATHDIELTELLKDEYDNYHFEEEIEDGDISFQYRLLSGKATTRNAIRLLEIMGYSPEVTGQAMKRAEMFLESGVWQA